MVSRASFLGRGSRRFGLFVTLLHCNVVAMLCRCMLVVVYGVLLGACGVLRRSYAPLV